jgi:hypothetical protein
MFHFCESYPLKGIHFRGVHIIVPRAGVELYEFSTPIGSFVSFVNSLTKELNRASIPHDGFSISFHYIEKPMRSEHYTPLRYVCAEILSSA